MANKEIYDYVSSGGIPDNDVTLSITPQSVIPEEGDKNQIIHLGDDGSEERISFSNDSIFFVTLEWGNIDESESGTIMDFFHSTAKGNGRNKTFKWEHPTDGHTYITRFATKLSRLRLKADIFGITQIRLKVLNVASGSS